MFLIRHCEGKGRGVFAQRAFAKGEVIERCPVIVIPREQQALVDQTVLYNYTYAWGSDEAIALGFGSLYNHSYSPNAVYRREMDNLVMEYLALRDIAKGDEITVNYNGSPEDRGAVWFEIAEEK